MVCEQLVGWAKEYLGEGGTTDEIEDAAKEMCNKLPSDYVDECLELVNGYLPVRLHFIFDISTFCQTMLDSCQKFECESLDLTELFAKLIFVLRTTFYKTNL